jgi:hypothetical protein
MYIKATTKYLIECLLVICYCQLNVLVTANFILFQFGVFEVWFIIVGNLADSFVIKNREIKIVN